MPPAGPSDDLPAGWRRVPAPVELQERGTRWARQERTAVLAVPSAVIPQELNDLLNPRRPAFRRIRVGPPELFSFDPRVWRG